MQHYPLLTDCSTTVASPGEYKWMIDALRRCVFMPDYFNRLLWYCLLRWFEMNGQDGWWRMMPVCLQTLKMSIVGRKRLFFVVTLFLCLAVFMDLCTYNIHTSISAGFYRTTHATCMHSADKPLFCSGQCRTGNRYSFGTEAIFGLSFTVL